MKSIRSIFCTNIFCFQCLGQTWYLSCDMQFYWLSPIIILPLWANWKYGLTWWSIIFATMTGVLGYITKVCRKPPTSIFAAVSFEDYGVDNPYPSYCGKQIFGSDGRMQWTMQKAIQLVANLLVTCKATPFGEK